MAQPAQRDLSDAAERRIRQDLAALYRLVALFGWDDLLATHLSARLPVEGEVFLINPLGLLFDEITASSLVKVNGDGEVLGHSDYGVNRAGFVIHSAVHRARPDAGCVVHLHTRNGVAVSATRDGLLALNQSAMTLGGRIGFHDYEGVAFDLDEQPRLQQDLSDHDAMFLRNHGTLVLGGTIAEAFARTYVLEWACDVQVRTLSMGVPLAPVPPAIIAKVEEQTGGDSGRRYANDLLWPAMLRRLKRIDQSFLD